MSAACRFMLVLCALAVVAACSKQTPSTMIGHWRAERVPVFSAELPIGPDIIVSEREISSPDAGMSLSVKGFEVKASEVTVDLAYGIGLTFYFDGPDRVYLKVPLAGKVFYRRVVDNVASVGAATPSALINAAPPSAPVLEANPERRSGSVANGSPSVAGQSAPAIQILPATSRSASGAAVAEGPSIAAFHLASTAAREGRSDAAIDYLNMAFKAGFRDFELLDSSSEFRSLTSDVRYQALIARYR